MSEKKNKDILSSWKEISDYLDCDPRTCLRWEKEIGLPIHRLSPQAKSRVFAYKKEIDAWVAERINNENNRKSKNGSKINLKILIIGLVPILSGLAFVFFMAAKNSPQPADFRIANSFLIILDEEGNKLWEKDTGLPNLMTEAKFRTRFQHKVTDIKRPIRWYPLLSFTDINGNGKKEVLFSPVTDDHLKSRKLICYNHKGGKLWEITTGKNQQYGSTRYSSDYYIFGFEFIDLEENGQKEIVVFAYHYQDFPTQLLLLNHSGEILGEYWNSGRIQDFTLTDLDGDGKTEMVTAAMNNEYKKAALIVFDPTNIAGFSPQNGEYKAAHATPGTELYYLLFPRTDVSLIDKPISSLPMVDIINNQLISCLAAYTKISYDFDFKLEILNVRLSHTFEQLHKMAHMENRITDPYDAETYQKRLAAGILYYDGDKWVSKPSKAN